MNLKNDDYNWFEKILYKFMYDEVFFKKRVKLFVLSIIAFGIYFFIDDIPEHLFSRV